MEDEILKRNTDCVYFLASPLTCKKGIECEYRHSESARLNPRDCWYWLSGSCFNPTCAFRHPPLDGLTVSSSESAALPHQSSVPVNKTNAPCYFYFNGFCYKGDRCSFLHNPNDVLPGGKSSKTASMVTDVHPMENKTSTGSDTRPASIDAPPNPSETTSKPVSDIQRKGDLQQSVLNIVSEPSPSPQILMPNCEEAAIKSDIPLPVEGFIESGSPLCLKQSSEEQSNGHIEEEWWESSPGFDVLVDDDGSENLGYKDDPDYLLAHDRGARELHNHLLQYDYEDRAGYDPMEYPDVENLYELGICDSYDHLENDQILDYVQEGPYRSRERMLDPMLFQERKFFPRELEVNGKNGVDLRDHLRKRKRIDGHLVSRNPRRHGSFRLNDQSREQHGRHGIGDPIHRRLSSEVGKNLIGSHSENEVRPNDNHQRGWLRHSQPRHNRFRHREKKRRKQARPQVLSSEISRGPAPSETSRHTQELTAFSGPKTLAQIKEEKRKARENEDGFGNTGHPYRATSVGFQGPKPRSEIKYKKRLGSVSDDNSSGTAKHDYIEHERNHDYLNKDDDNFVDEDDEDEDGFEKKLSSIFS